MRSVLLSHVGAGRHDYQKKQQYSNLLRKCGSSIEKLKTPTVTEPSSLNRCDSLLDDSLLDILKASSQVLESSPLTNTGYGSSLNIDGEVECDASVVLVLDGKMLRSSVYNITSDRFPVTKCIQSLKSQNCENLMGITNPVMVRDSRCKSEGSCSEVELISPRAQAFYKKYRNHISPADPISDTVGITILDSQGNVAMGTSSGGNMFKQPGRLGCAAVVGAGVFSKRNERYIVTMMCSGNGEDIIAMDLARSCCTHILNSLGDELDPQVCYDSLGNAVEESARDILLKAKITSSQTGLYVGCYGLVLNRKSGETTVVYAHSTETFVFRYETSDKEGRKGKTIFSRLGKRVGSLKRGVLSV